MVNKTGPGTVPAELMVSRRHREVGAEGKAVSASGSVTREI